LTDLFGQGCSTSRCFRPAPGAFSSFLAFLVASVFTNGHAEMAFSDFCADLQRLDEFIDWSVMRSAYWNDTIDQPDRKRRRQAEFLVQEFFPWTAIERIGVRDQPIRQRVELALIKAEYKPEVVVEAGWYN
jgi:hypothetical protein